MASEKANDMALLILRLAVGVIIGAHGLQKIYGIWGGPGIENFSNFIGSLGFEPPLVWAWAAALSEAIGGMLLVLGILPRLSALSIAATMGVAIYKVHWNGLFASNGGFEYPLLILCACVAIIIAGAGRISVLDRL